MAAPLVSILIPAYNAQEWIVNTLESALAQTWARKEIVVVDDGSTDDTLAIARRYARPGVLVVSHENSGAAATRNAAFSMCQGTYVQWLDADDLLSPGKIERQMEVVERCGDSWLLMSCPWAYFMYRPQAARFEGTALWRDLGPLDWMLQKWNHNTHMQTATWLVSRELTEAAGPWNPQLLGDDDGEYFARVVLASHGVRFVSDARVYYRVVGQSRLSHIGQSRRKLEAHLASMTRQIEYVRGRDDGPRVRAAVITYLQTWLPHFYPEHPDLVEQFQTLAWSVGGELKAPGMGAKYAVVDRLFGRVAAKRLQLHYRHHKTSLLRSWDRFVGQVVGDVQ